MKKLIDLTATEIFELENLRGIMEQSLIDYPEQDENGIVIKHVSLPTFRLQGYMVEYFECYEAKIPVLFIDGQLWMSITPMEIQSHWLPIQQAKGTVLVGGLGMGFYLNNILDEDKVDKVIVYEIDSRVIKFYKSLFGTHEKLEIIEGSILDASGIIANYTYVDIYPDMLPNECVEHMHTIIDNNDVAAYTFWGQSYALMGCINDADSDMQVCREYRPSLEVIEGAMRAIYSSERTCRITEADVSDNFIWALMYED